MNYYIKTTLYVSVLLLFLLSGCATTSVTGVWKKSYQPQTTVTLKTTAPVCSKTITFLQGKGIEINYY